MLLKDWALTVESELRAAGFHVFYWDGFPAVHPSKRISRFNALIRIDLSVSNSITVIDGNIVFLPTCEVKVPLEGLMSLIEAVGKAVGA